MYDRVRILTLGEAGLVAEFAATVDRAANEAVRLLDRAIRAAAAGSPAGAWLTGTVPTYRSLLVAFDPLRIRATELRDLLESEAARILAAARDLPAGATATGGGADGREVVIPVCYEGELAPDLADVATQTGLAPAQVVQLHTGTEYLVHMIGFLVGYPYMASLPSQLRLPRLSRPRLKTPTGSVAIAGELTGIYPLPSPGGWRVLGTTPWPMYDLKWDPPALLLPGDRVRFRPISQAEYTRLLANPEIPAALYTPAPQDGQGGPTAAGSADPILRVIRPGLLATVQDLGRPGYLRYGIGPGGAMDKFALRVGNRLVGNEEGAAAIELTGAGAVIDFLRPARVVWAAPGGNARLADRELPAWTVMDVDRGMRFTAGAAPNALRGYLCIGGGVASPLIMGSRSTNLAAGFGGPFGRPLKAGDELATAGSCADRPLPLAEHRVLDAVYHRLDDDVSDLRVLPGPQDDMFDESALSLLFGATYQVSSDSNRMGYRMEGPAVAASQGHDIVSDGLVEGAIQVPGNGQPVLLGADHQTTGGYPKPGVIVGADLPLLAQLAPGRKIRLTRVDLDTAINARLELEHAVAQATGSLVAMDLRIDGRRFEVKIDTHR